MQPTRSEQAPAAVPAGYCRVPEQAPRLPAAPGAQDPCPDTSVSAGRAWGSAGLAQQNLIRQQHPTASRGAAVTDREVSPWHKPGRTWPCERSPTPPTPAPQAVPGSPVLPPIPATLAHWAP